MATVDVVQVAGGRAETQRLRARRSLQPDRVLLILFLLPALAYVVLFFAYPLYIDVKMSIEQYSFGAIIAGHGPFVGLSNYRAAFSGGATTRAILNTVVFTVASIVLQFGIGFAMALYFNQKFPGSEIIRKLILIPWVMPLVAVGTIFELIFTTPTGLADQIVRGLGIVHGNVSWLTSGTLAMFAIIIANIWAGIPFNALLLYSGVQDVPKELLEAASVDGAGMWKRFAHVTVPSMRGVILIVLMLGVVYTVKAFDLVIILTGGGPANESQLLSSWAYNLALTQFQFGEGAAVGNVLLVFCLLVGLVYVWISRTPGETRKGAI